MQNLSIPHTKNNNKKHPVKPAIAMVVGCFSLAGAEGLEPSTYGFGDRRSTN